MEDDDYLRRLMQETPLVRFSVYTYSQVEILLDLAEQIEAHLNASISEGKVGREWREAYSKFWLWVLGVYEVVRTMSQAQVCFSERLAAELLKFKRRMAQIRMPFAKQELKGRSEPIGLENSIVGFNFETRDILFEVEGEPLGMRQFITEFRNLIEGISPKDVLSDHRTSYGDSLK